QDSIFVLMENDSVSAAHHVPAWVKCLPLGVAAGGIALAYVFYMRARHLPAVMSGMFSITHNFFYRKWYFDELYHRIGVVPAFFLGRRLWKTGDGKVIDGLGPDGVAAAVDDAAGTAGRAQSGYLYDYAFAILAGV